jgi:hypothetical protein
MPGQRRNYDRPRPRPRHEALGTIESTGPFERALARLLMAVHKRRLRAIVKVVPTWVSEETMRVGAHRGPRRSTVDQRKLRVKNRSSDRTLWHYGSKRIESAVAGFRNKSAVKTQPT